MKRNKYFPHVFDQNWKLKKRSWVLKRKKKLVIEIRTDFQKSKQFQVDDSSFKFDRRNDFFSSTLIKIELVVFDKSAEEFINLKDNARLSHSLLHT